MELVWLIVQALAVCTALLAVTCGLMLAPWYVLLAALGIVLIVIQQLMSGLRRNVSEPAISGVKGISSIARTDAPIKPTQMVSIAASLADPGSPHLIYRGVDYVPAQDGESPLAASHATHLVYRGIDYVLQGTKSSPTDSHSTHLVYRGVDYVLSQDK